MTRTLATEPKKQNGFTLLEILLVLGILAMVAMLIVPGLRSLDAPSFNAQVREAVGLLNYARRMAIVNGQPQRIEFVTDNTDSQDVETDVAGRWESQDVQLSYLNSTAVVYQDQTNVAVEFYPEGGSTGGELQFRQAERIATIRIDPFSGRVQRLSDD